MLIADPSSTCDVCMEKFSTNRECWSIPCGHIFCHECLSHLTQPVCPMCRASLRNPSLMAQWPLRKVHVDMSKCGKEDSDGPDFRGARRLRRLEQRLVAETLVQDEAGRERGKGLTVQRAAELAKEIGEVLRTQSPNEYGLLRTIQTLLLQLSAIMAHVYESSSLDKAVKASYEHRIKQLEHSLMEQARQLSRGEPDDKVHTRGQPDRPGSIPPRPRRPSSPPLYPSHLPKQENIRPDRMGSMPPRPRRPSSPPIPSHLPRQENIKPNHMSSMPPRPRRPSFPRFYPSHLPEQEEMKPRY